MAALIAIPIIFGVTFCVSAYYSFAYGFVASCIWSWFLVPMGFPVLHWKACAAVLMLVNMMRHNSPDSPKKQDGADIAGNILGLVIAPWFVLAVAWFIHG